MKGQCFGSPMPVLLEIWHQLLSPNFILFFFFFGGGERVEGRKEGKEYIPQSQKIHNQPLNCPPLLFSSFLFVVSPGILVSTVSKL